MTITLFKTPRPIKLYEARIGDTWHRVEDEGFACPFCGNKMDEHGSCCGEVNHAEMHYLVNDEWLAKSDLDEIALDYGPRDVEADNDRLERYLADNPNVIVTELENRWLIEPIREC